MGVICEGYYHREKDAAGFMGGCMHLERIWVHAFPTTQWDLCWSGYEVNVRVGMILKV